MKAAVKLLRTSPGGTSRRAVPGFAFVFSLLAVLLAGCGAGTRPATLVSLGQLERAELSPGERLHVVASTSFVGDVLGQVGGDELELEVLLPRGVDPHGYAPTPQDLRRVSQADVVFVNGLGLEDQLLLEVRTAAPDTTVVSLSEGIEPLGLEVHLEKGTEEHDSGEAGADPHVWFDPLNVRTWTSNASVALSALDPERSQLYRENGAAYTSQLQELDAWIRAQVEQVPDQDRQLVTEHLVFGYFADRYGFEMVGAIVPGYSSVAEPSAEALAELERLIMRRGVDAVFVSATQRSTLAEQVAGDLGIEIVGLYIESLGDPGGPADTYLKFMRFNVERIVTALG